LVLTLSGGDVPDPFLSNAVFMTHKWFISSEELLRKFMQRYSFHHVVFFIVNYDCMTEEKNWNVPLEEGDIYVVYFYL